ncbi:hypothetical protein F5148DRAFT_1284366 [Russula earlei]|uniref:Uncharacterized protein n=1 Tax=Russula earlei TaxID=71964 RepID=A0ACC0U919_9AGAM|nr:hypothetical protein F5148DRAFT_1284366 [Russula earlei]
MSINSSLSLLLTLELDSSTAPATSIEDESELEIFVMKMRALIVPLRLATRKLSKRGPPKNLMVCFEDGTMEEKKTGNADRKGKKNPTSATASVIDPLEKEREEILDKLQNKWQCDYHTKMAGCNAYCHPNTSTGGATPFGTMGGHGITMPIILHLEWGQYQQILSAQPAGNQVAPPPLPPAVKISVEIEQWFQEFEDNPLCNMKGFKFLEFGRVLKSQGFTQIMQLSQSFITIQDLQGVLKIDMGTAIFIMDYTQEDVQQFKEAGGSFSVH